MIVMLGAKLVVAFGNIDADGDVIEDANTVNGMTREYRVSKLNEASLFHAASQAFYDRQQLNIAYTPQLELEPPITGDEPPVLTVVEGNGASVVPDDEWDGEAGAPVLLDPVPTAPAPGDTASLPADPPAATEPVAV